jgi:hypothetical protein
MHEYIEVQFRRNGKAFWLSRQISEGFEFEEANAEARAIEIGFSAFDPGTELRMQRIRQVKGWDAQSFKLRISVEDGSLVIRGDDEFSLPEGFYDVTANVSGAKVKKRPGRVEVPHDQHGVVVIDLEIDDRTIEVDLEDADPAILDLLGASTIDEQSALDWVKDDDVSPKSRACVLNLVANLRVFPKLSDSLLTETTCLFKALEERAYAEVSTAFYDKVSELSEERDNTVYPEGRPHAPIHALLIAAIGKFEASAGGLFTEDGLLSFRAEGSPSLQMVIATPTAPFASRFVDLDLDLGNPLQDVAGLVVHIGELLNGQPTNHLDLRKKLSKGKAAPFLYYKVVSPA